MEDDGLLDGTFEDSFHDFSFTLARLFKHLLFFNNRKSKSVEQVFIYHETSEHLIRLQHNRNKFNYENRDEINEQLSHQLVSESECNNKMVGIKKNSRNARRSGRMESRPMESSSKQNIAMTEPLNSKAPLDGKEVEGGEDGSACPRHRIKQRYHRIGDRDVRKEKNLEVLACKPHRSSTRDCMYAYKIYEFNEDLLQCEDSKSHVEYCNVQLVKTIDMKSNVKVSCKNDSRNSCALFQLSGFNNKTGRVEFVDLYRTVKKLEIGLLTLVEKTIRIKIYFVFIHCFHGNGTRIGRQLMVLPSINQHEGFDAGFEDSGTVMKPNVNVVLLDSISRAHFYRSLPVVIEKFNEINTKSNHHHHNQNAEVLDFQLFQSVHGHSAENFHALFTGTLFPKTMQDSEKEEQKVGADELFTLFKRAGYQTMYQDDLCWQSWWGMRMELGSASNWSSFSKAIEASKIDTTGLTFSSCEILKANKLNTPFNGPDSNQICFNGKFQHSYLFQFLHQFYKETSLHNTRPRFSFTAINTAHDYAGLRVQTLNNDLAEFVHEMSLLQNTLTILMADHGNTYTKYTNAVMEGRYEMFHPSFFMIIPHGVAKYFGHETMQSLRLNSNRLFTMLDVHASLKSIAEKATNKQMKGNKGILEVIPANRTCNDLDLRLPNLCVCEGWDTEVRNDTRQVAALEFAVGTLNNLILKQQEGHGELTAKCNRLYPLYFSNVRERSAGEHLITTMDFRVKAGQGADQTEDIFHVEIQSTIKPDHDSMAMKLLSFDRLSQYGIYRKCQDKKVDIRLCICSLDDEKNQSLRQSNQSNVTVLTMHQPRLDDMPMLQSLEDVLDSNGCVYLQLRRYFALNNAGSIEEDNVVAASIELWSTCAGAVFNVSMSIETSNMKASDDIPLYSSVQGRTMRYLVSFGKDVPYWESSLTAVARAEIVTS
eukprot:gene19098-21014_t